MKAANIRTGDYIPNFGKVAQVRYYGEDSVVFFTKGGAQLSRRTGWEVKGVIRTTPTQQKAAA